MLENCGTFSFKMQRKVNIRAFVVLQFLSICQGNLNKINEQQEFIITFKI